MAAMCAAGRTAFFGGRWTEACIGEGRRVIGSRGNEPIRLCEAHFAEVSAGSLVKDPAMTEAEFKRWEQELMRPPVPGSTKRRRLFGPDAGG